MSFRLNRMPTKGIVARMDLVDEPHQPRARLPLVFRGCRVLPAKDRMMIIGER